MMQVCRIALLGVAAIAAVTGTLQAGLITNTVEIDLSQATITDDGWGGHLLSGYPSTGVSITPFTATLGDVLETTVTFKNGDRLRIIDGPNTIDSTPPVYFDSLTFYFSAGSVTGGVHTSSTTSAVFLDLQGSLASPTPRALHGVLGHSLGSNITDDEVSFTGIVLTSTFTALSGSPITYDTFGLWGGRAGRFEIESGAAAVPEPSSLALLLSGGLIGAVRLSRRRRT